MCAHLDMSDPDLIGRVRAAGHHMRPLEAYLGGLPVLEEAEIRPFQRAQVRESERFLADRALWSDPDRFWPLPVPGLRGRDGPAVPQPPPDRGQAGRLRPGRAPLRGPGLAGAGERRAAPLQVRIAGSTSETINQVSIHA
jgi:hypothetical protein